MAPTSRFAQFLQEKGLLRPMSRVDRARLLERAAAASTASTAAPRSARTMSLPLLRARCRACSTWRGWRARSTPRARSSRRRCTAIAARHAALQCGACGAALPPGSRSTARSAARRWPISRLAEAHERVAALGPALRAHAQKPAPEVVKRRLEALDADLPRRREFAAQMEAEADAAPRPRRSATTSTWRDLVRAAGTNPLRAVLIALRDLVRLVLLGLSRARSAFGEQLLDQPLQRREVGLADVALHDVAALVDQQGGRRALMSPKLFAIAPVLSIATPNGRRRDCAKSATEAGGS